MTKPTVYLVPLLGKRMLPTFLTLQSHPFSSINLSLTLFLGLCFLQVSVGPFTIVKSIDNLTETLADIMPAERRGYTLSTKNIGNKNILTHIKKIIVCQCIVQNTGDTISVVIKVDGEIGEI